MKIKEVKSIIENMEVEEALEYLNNIRNSSQLNLEKLIEKYQAKKNKLHKEIERIEKMMYFENLAYKHNYNIVCGIDEAGRGPLAGPVVAAAVIFPKGKYILGVNDSKKLSAKKREELYTDIIEKSISYGVGIVDEKIIDKINILNATKNAMTMAIDALNIKPECLFIDSVKLESIKIKQKSIDKGDTLSFSIAAASIIAKVTRDRIMEGYDDNYPEYGFSKHKGYGTEKHIQAIKKVGICPIHRMSFTKKFI